jgi:hypothetical protein
VSCGIEERRSAKKRPPLFDDMRKFLPGEVPKVFLGHCVFEQSEPFDAIKVSKSTQG